jgi:HK97 gp10 family phage protein
MAATRVITGGVAFKWEGVPQMRKLFNEFAIQLGPDGMGEARAQLKDVLMKPALVLRDEARDLAPEGATGKLKQSIRVTKGPEDKRGVLVYVDTSKNRAYYARFVERGTSKMAAKPFFRFAIQATRRLIANLIAEDLQPVIEGMATKLGWHPCTAT